MSKRKNRKDRDAEYLHKFGGIPNFFEDRLIHLLEKLNINETMIQNILNRKSTIESKTYFKKLQIVFYEIPKASQRPRFTSKGFKFYVPEAADDRKYMKIFIKGNLDEFRVITTPMIIDLKAFFPTPTGFTKEEKILAELGYINPIIPPDWDNIGKKYTDMQNNEIFVDDSLIIDGRVSKHYSVKPRIEITIQYMNGYTSNTQLRTLTNRKTYLDLLEENKVDIPEYIR